MITSTVFNHIPISDNKFVYIVPYKNQLMKGTIQSVEYRRFEHKGYLTYYVIYIDEGVSRLKAFPEDCVFEDIKSAIEAM